MIGKTISHYEILEKLGEGGMGTVYRAEDIKLKRMVAIKFLPPELTRDPKAKQRFMHEAQAASALDHPNIGVIHEVDETDDGQLFIAMAYYLGKTLQDTIEVGPLPFDEAIRLAIQIAQGLAEAHAKEIVHRDIKPANIMITEKDQVKIVDFGLAKLAGRTQLTKAGATLGTVSYMSPEQAEGIAVDQRTDIWSLAVVLYEMITGEQPFKGEYEMAVLHSIVYDEPDSVTSLGADVPVGMERIVEKGMAKNPEERFQTMDEMLSELQMLSEELKSGQLKKRRPMFRSSRKQRAYLYRVMATLIVLMIVGALFLWQNVQHKETDAISVAKNRIAVLPLANISRDPEDEYFTDGMTEELISGLSKINNLRVIARTSVMRYKGVAKSVAEIGRELNVGTVIEGSVRKAANRLRISVQLIDAQSQELLWSQDYNRELKDVFAIQSHVAQQVAEVLKIQLQAEEKQRIAKKSTENVEAYSLYLKGRYFWNKRDEESLKKGVEYFQRAIDIDGSFALAYSGLADSYGVLGWLSSDRTPKESSVKFRQAAKKALEIDDTLAEAHTSLAQYLFWYRWDWLGAEREFKRALELNPNYATGHQWYAHYLAFMGRSRDGLLESKIAQELDPLSLIINATWVVRLYYARLYDEAMEQCQRTLELDRNFTWAHWYLGLVYEQKGVCEKAIEEFEKAISLSGDSQLNVSALGHSYAICGRKDEAQQIVGELRAGSKRHYVSPYHIAVIYTGLGEKDHAFEWLEKAYVDRALDLVRLKVEPRLDPLRSDPRFQDLLRRMNFPE